jgi:hypothetical protein
VDARDETTWLVLELTPQGESAATDGLLEGLLRDHGGLPPEHPVFIPLVVCVHKGVRSVLSVMEGYAFVASGVDDSFFRRLRPSPYVRRIMSRGTGIRKIAETISDTDISILRKNLNMMVGAEISEGMKVRVIDGPLVGITGKVVELHGEKAFVHVAMRSLYAIRYFPRFFLHPVNDDE